MLAPGAQVDRYVVERLVGRGGQAAVYLVRHRLLGTRHALKVLHRGGGPEVHARLVREGRLQARLDPTFVVPVHDVITVDGAPALVLPFVSGCTLDEVLEIHRPTQAEVISLFSDVCAGVARAHDAGVVHRDLKPGNVMLELKRGRVVARVADFGLARVMHGEETGEGYDAKRTLAGRLMGSPAYAAPEQLIDARHADHRADLWSLGVMLFELLTGQVPFQAANMWHLVERVRAGVFDSTAIPEPWRPTIRELLSLDPEDRPDSVDVVLAQVRALGSPAPLTERTPIAAVVRARAAMNDAAVAGGRAHRGHGPTIGPEALLSGSDAHHTVETIDAPGGEPKRHNLPTERGAFVGRYADLLALDEHLKRGERLVTVLGVGGCGKTRLVVHYGQQHLDSWPGGVWFCDLSEARSLEGVAYAVAQALDVPLAARDPIERLGHALAGRGRCLVLLDNAEQVQADVADALERWLDRAVEARFVVTTRVVLAVAGEQTLPLQPLAPSDSAALFRVRARAAGRDLGHDADMLAAIDELVDLLDHLPLAIELAAARSRVLPPRQLLGRMTDRFRVLTSTGGRSERQATLRATLKWSWELLNPWERATLSQLAVFDGGFDLEAAEHVVQLDADAPWTLDLVQSLVDSSLVRTVGDDRFALLMSVQEFAAEALATTGDPESVRRRHAAWYSTFGRPEAVSALRLHGSRARRATLALDVHNLEAANAWSVAHDEADYAVQTAMAAWALYGESGPFGAGAALLRATVALGSLTPEQLHRLSYNLGWAEQLLGRLDEAATWYESALASAEQAGDARDVCHVLNNYSTLHKVKGRLDEALALSERSLQLATELGDRAQIGIALGNVAVVAADRGRFEDARAAYREAIDIAVEIGDARQEGIRVGNLATLLAMKGDLDGALPLFERALECAREVGSRRSQGIVHANLGLLHHQQGRVDQARVHLDQGLVLAREAGDPMQQAVCMGYLGALAQSQGEHEAALQHQQAALAIGREAGSRQRQGIAAGHLGHLHRIAGRVDIARARLEEALQAHRAIGMRYWQASWLAGLALLDAGAGHVESSLDRIAEAVALSEPYPVVQAEVRASEARIQLARGDVQAAIEAVDAGRALHQTGRLDALLWAVRALVAAEEGDADRCRDAVRRAEGAPEHSPPGTELHQLIERAKEWLSAKRPDA